MPSPSAERVLLTYPNPGVTRLCIFGSIALVTYVSIRLVDAWPKHHGPQIAAWTSWWPMVSICTLLFSLALTVLEGLFVLGQKWDAMKLEFDADNFYITVPQGERTIPLQEITSFRLIYGKRLVDNSRVPLYRYAIRFGDRKDAEEVTFTIFRKTAYNFSDFLSLVKEKNPSVEIKNSATNWDRFLK